jgi:hypothetical protein
MFCKNIKMSLIDDEYIIEIESHELDEIYKKYGGIVNLKITKPISPGTDLQNNACHALMQEFWLSKCHSAPAEIDTFDKFKFWLKESFGVCYDWTDTKSHHVPISWSDYNKQQRSEFISTLIVQIEDSGAMDVRPKIQDILKTMEDNSLIGANT